MLFTKLPDDELQLPAAAEFAAPTATVCCSVAAFLIAAAVSALLSHATVMFWLNQFHR